VIKHFYLKQWTAANMKAQLCKVHGVLKRPFTFMLMNSNVVEHQPQIKRAEVAKLEMIEKNPSLLKGCEKAEIIGVSLGTVHYILHKKLEMKKLISQ
jgi:hypothetical protein